MKTIYKYEILIKDAFSMELPIGAEILTVQEDQKTGNPCIWAMVDTEAPKEVRFFEILGTGQNIYVDMGVERKYIGTFQIEHGLFVGHLFEKLS